MPFESAVLSDPEGDLLPGLYVRVRIEQAVRKNALAVPQKAVMRDAQGNAQVYVLKDETLVDLRRVRLGATLGDRWLVESGLEAGETIVVEGAQKLYPGATVAPEVVTAEPAPASADPAAAPAAANE